MTTTIILTVSRGEFLQRILSALELLDCDSSYTNILCVVDGNNELFVSVRNAVQNTKFNERLTLKYPNSKPVKKFDIMYRRKRITDIHRFAQQNVGISDYILLTEDDTVLPPNTLKNLTSAITSRPGIAFVEGVEIGRWGIPYIGAWNFDDIYNPTEVVSVPYKDDRSVEPIDAGGFYCALILANVYKDYKFSMFESLGPDISMGLHLRQQGYQCMVDWSVPCVHLNLNHRKETEMLIPNDNAKVVKLKRKSADNWIVNT